MDSALDPLDLVEHTARCEKSQTSTINSEVLAQYLEEIAQEAAGFINADHKKEFLYKNPNGWHLRKRHHHVYQFVQKKKAIITSMKQISNDSSKGSSSPSLARLTSSSDTSEQHEDQMEPWTLIEDFDFHICVRQVNEFIGTWELSPATKFVVLGLNETENKPPFGQRYFVEALFSKPTPKCPNPLAVAKVSFQINVSHLLPKDYPVNVTYRFEGYKSQFYAMGEHKINSNKFQRYFIDSILHMKLSFYAKLSECHSTLKPFDKA